MSTIKRIFDFYLDASIHVAFSVLSMIWLTDYMLHFKFDVDLAMFLFFSTIASYNFVKYGLEGEKYILLANQYHKQIQILSFGVLALTVYFAINLTLNTWVGILALSVLIALYAIPMLPHGKNLRNFGGFKIILVALVWAGTTIFLPLLQSNSSINWDVEIELVQRFIMVLSLMLPFEVRDLRYDPPELRTVPQRLGVKKTKIIGVILVLILFTITFLKDDLQYIELCVKAFISLSLLFSILFTNENRSKYYASFWVELLPVLWLAMTWLLTKLI